MIINRLQKRRKKLSTYIQIGSGLSEALTKDSQSSTLSKNDTAAVKN